MATTPRIQIDDKNSHTTPELTTDDKMIGIQVLLLGTPSHKHQINEATAIFAKKKKTFHALLTCATSLYVHVNEFTIPAPSDFL
jgi:hypothetical protein